MRVTYCGAIYCFEPKCLVPHDPTVSLYGVPVCPTLLPASSAVLPEETTHGRGNRGYCLLVYKKYMFAEQYVSAEGMLALWFEGPTK